MNNRIKYILKHWKQGVHLVFRTKRVGVNNRWWCDCDSIFGWSNWRIFFSIITIIPIIENIKQMKLRAGGMAHMMTDEEYELTYGESK